MGQLSFRFPQEKPDEKPKDSEHLKMLLGLIRDLDTDDLLNLIDSEGLGSSTMERAQYQQECCIKDMGGVSRTMSFDAYMNGRRKVFLRIVEQVLLGKSKNFEEAIAKGIDRGRANILEILNMLRQRNRSVDSDSPSPARNA